MSNAQRRRLLKGEGEGDVDGGSESGRRPQVPSPPAADRTQAAGRIERGPDGQTARRTLSSLA